MWRGPCQVRAGEPDKARPTIQTKHYDVKNALSLSAIVSAVLAVVASAVLLVGCDRSPASTGTAPEAATATARLPMCPARRRPTIPRGACRPRSSTTTATDGSTCTWRTTCGIRYRPIGCARGRPGWRTIATRGCTRRRAAGSIGIPKMAALRTSRRKCSSAGDTVRRSVSRRLTSMPGDRAPSGLSRRGRGGDEQRVSREQAVRPHG